MNINHFSSPQVLSGEVTLSLPAGSGVAPWPNPPVYGTVSLDTLASRSRRWFLAESLRIQASPQVVAPAGSFIGPFAMFVAFSTKFSAYRRDLTRDYVNTNLLGPSTMFMGGISQGNAVANPALSFSYYEPTQHFRIVFPKPFLIPPGDAFNAQFRAQLMFFAGSTAFPTDLPFRINCTLAGKMVGEDEAKRLYAGKNPLPYITSFEPPWLPTSGNAGVTYISNNLELANPFTRPLFVQRMIGLQQTSREFYNPEGVNISIEDTRTVVAEEQNFSNLFSPQCGAWTFKRVLQPTEYLKARIVRLGTSNPTPAVSLIGYREEEMP